MKLTPGHIKTAGVGAVAAVVAWPVSAAPIDLEGLKVVPRHLA